MMHTNRVLIKGWYHEGYFWVNLDGIMSFIYRNKYLQYCYCHNNYFHDYPSFLL